MTAAELRAAVVAEAMSWIGTPYCHMGRVKGAGADCLSLLAEVYERAGVTGHLELPFYPMDWCIHQSGELYIEGVSQYAREIDGPPEPGDIAIWRLRGTRTYSHGAIVTDWPRVIHSFIRTGTIPGNASAAPLAGCPVRFFTPF